MQSTVAQRHTAVGGNVVVKVDNQVVVGPNLNFLTGERHGRFSHLRNMRVLCKPFVNNQSCDVADCPYSHKVGEMRIPGDVCRFDVCKMTNCEFFHGSFLQWEALKQWRDSTFPSPATYRPTDYLEQRDPHEEVERMPAPTGTQLIDGVRKQLMGGVTTSVHPPPPPPPSIPVAQAHYHHSADGGTPTQFVSPTASQTVSMTQSPVQQIQQAPQVQALVPQGYAAVQQPQAQQMVAVPSQNLVQQPQQQQQQQRPVTVVPQLTVLKAPNGATIAWFCAQCNTQNSMELFVCNHCEVPTPWSCIVCHNPNFGSRASCSMCRSPKPQNALGPVPQGTVQHVPMPTWPPR